MNFSLDDALMIIFDARTFFFLKTTTNRESSRRRQNWKMNKTEMVNFIIAQAWCFWCFLLWFYGTIFSFHLFFEHEMWTMNRGCLMLRRWWLTITDKPWWVGTTKFFDGTHTQFKPKQSKPIGLVRRKKPWKETMKRKWKKKEKGNCQCWKPKSRILTHGTIHI